MESFQPINNKYIEENQPSRLTERQIIDDFSYYFAEKMLMDLYEASYLSKAEVAQIHQLNLKIFHPILGDLMD